MPDRLDLLFDDEEPPAPRVVPRDEARMARALAPVVGASVPVKETRLDLLMEMEQLTGNAPRSNGGGVYFLGNVENESLGALYSGEGAFQRVGVLHCDIGMGSPSGTNPLHFILYSFSALAESLNMKAGFEQAIRTTILGTSANPGRATLRVRNRYDDYGYNDYPPDDYVHDQMERARAASDWSGLWRELLIKLRDAAVGKDTLVVVIDAHFAVGTDFVTLLRQLERLRIEGLSFFILGRTDMIEMRMTADYAARFGGTGGGMDDRVAEMARHNARHDMMRHGRIQGDD